MALPWLTALKVIPWGDVIEHAPTVLKGARDLLERQRQRRKEPGPPPTAPAGVEMPDPAPPEVSELQQQLASTRADLARLQQTQDQIAQTLAELAEQNTRLVAAVEQLRKRTRLLLWGGAVLAVGCAVLAFNAA